MLVRRNLKQRNRFYLTLISFPIVSSRFTHTLINKNLLSCQFRSFPVVSHIVSGRFRYYETPVKKDHRQNRPLGAGGRLKGRPTLMNFFHNFNIKKKSPRQKGRI